MQAKERARAALSKRYRSGALSEDDILLCIYSISDNNSYLLFNRDPIDRRVDILACALHCGVKSGPKPSVMRCGVALAGVPDD